MTSHVLFFIVVGVICYLTIGLFFAGMAKGLKANKDIFQSRNQAFVWFIVVLWPLLIIVAFVALTFSGLSRILKPFTLKVFKAGENTTKRMGG